ncbi:hypothetical protein BJ741DRAFT_619660 [Chytriomyces cf. hyalinus JEL632]|nr:hypothetical protein BJ741DRAFT_619660 [Chytriomyces cf. hyalinus JEL632]
MSQSKKEQKIMMAHNAAAQLANDKKYREAVDKYQDFYWMVSKDSPYKWFAILAIYSLLSDHREVPWKDGQDNEFFEKIVGSSKEPAVIRAQAYFCLGRHLVLSGDRDASESYFINVVSIYESMKPADLKAKLMMGGDPRGGPKFTTVGQYKVITLRSMESHPFFKQSTHHLYRQTEKDSAYNTAIASLNQMNSSWNEDDKVKSKKSASSSKKPGPRKLNLQEPLEGQAARSDAEDSEEGSHSSALKSIKKEGTATGTYLSIGVVVVAVVYYLYISTKYY